MSCILIVDRYMPHNGGSRRYYHQLALQLPDVVVLTGPQPGGDEFDRTSGVKTLRRPGIRPNYAVAANSISNPMLNLLLAYGPGLVATLLWTLIELLRRRPDVVHAGGYAFAGFAARIWCPLFGIPFIVYAHGEDVLSTSRRRFFSRFMNWVMSRADGVVVNSRNTADLVRKVGVECSRIRVAWPGVDCKWFESPATVADLAVDLLDPWPSGPIFLTVGRLVKHKGHATVLKVLPGLLEKWPGLTWILVGTGPQEKQLRELAHELGVSHSIHFLSNLSDDQLSALYRIADLFVQPNGEVDGAFEGYGMVFLEAGAAGLPVVGGNHGGVPEVVEHRVTGMLVKPFDVSDLKSALELLLVDEELRLAMGRNNQIWAKSRTWESTLAEAVKLSSDLVEEGVV